MKFKSFHSRRGQTLVEALVALSILTVGFVGITTLLTQSFQLNRTTADDTEATYLASEGIEIVKSLIDHDVYFGLAQSSSTNDWGNCFPSSGYYYPIDYETITAAQGTTDDCSGLNFSTNQTDGATPLYFDPIADLYTTNAADGTPTDFTRTIEITDGDVGGTPEEIDVQSAVTWNNGELSNTITLEDQFYDWHP